MIGIFRKLQNSTDIISVTNSGKMYLWIPVIALLVSSALITTCTRGNKRSKLPSVINKKVAGAEPAKTENCLMCHEDVLNNLIEAEGVHKNIIKTIAGENYCESCHGYGSRHMESNDPADIFNKEDMKKLSSMDKNDTCLSCHETMKSQWIASRHNSNETSCWQCHGNAIHGSPEKFGIEIKPPIMLSSKTDKEFCFQCHEETVAEFMLQFHHPINENNISCTSCHSIHGEFGKVETEISEGETCLKCHTHIAGPWVFEHEALRDGCEICHQPHGGANRKLLKMNNNVLCLQCHFQTDFPMIKGMNHQAYIGAGTTESTCWQCHFEVHGSNSSPTFSPGR